MAWTDDASLSVPTVPVTIKMLSFGQSAAAQGPLRRMSVAASFARLQHDVGTQNGAYSGAVALTQHFAELV